MSIQIRSFIETSFMKHQEINDCGKGENFPFYRTKKTMGCCDFEPCLWLILRCSWAGNWQNNWCHHELSWATTATSDWSLFGLILWLKFGALTD